MTGDDLKQRLALTVGELAHIYGAQATQQMLANLSSALNAHSQATFKLSQDGVPVVPIAARIRQVMLEVMQEAGITEAQMRGSSKIGEICAARFEAWARTYALGGISLTQIGRYYGRDHTTILSGIRRVRAVVKGGKAA